MNEIGQIQAINIEDEMRGCYLDYAMSVIIGRALPDVRDGLKPVHRRILYAMFREGLLSNKRYSKCAGVVGEVLKKYHPHGDNAVYDTLVRMAQPWNLRYPLIDGQGNFGSVDGDSPAAYRYTESRLQKMAEELLADIDKDTVDFGPNFDDSVQEPLVLPTKVPNLLINGSEGIAVGMATKVPPHNLGEIIDALKLLIKNPDASLQQIMKIVPGPDFPTAGFIVGDEGIKKAYETGRGIIKLQAKARIEELRGDREAIVIDEIPYQVNKAKLIESMAQLVRNGKVEGISDLRDESDREGMRVVIELKKGTIAEVILNQLYKFTSMRTSYGIIFLSIVSGQPKVLGIKPMLKYFIEHRKEVVIRRTSYELRQAEARAHILEGLKIAVENIDAVIALIKKSKNPAEARQALIENFQLSEIQAQAILDLRLQKLTGLERDKIIAEYNEILEIIKGLKEILANEHLIFEIISTELNDIRKRFVDERRTQIIADQGDLSIEDLIQEEEMVVTISHTGYIKRNTIDLYRSQKRGGSGKSGMSTKDEDFVEQIFTASTHSYVLVISSLGKLYWLKVHEIPQMGRTSRGKAIVNLVRMVPDEKIAAVLTVTEFVDNQYIVMGTKKGVIKRVDLMAFSKPRHGGIIALTIDENDELIAASLAEEDNTIFIGTQHGKAIRFEAKQVRAMGRTAMGVRGINLADGDEVVSMEVVSDAGASLLTVAANGYGKKTSITEYKAQGRGGMGILTMKVTDKTGDVVAVKQVVDADDLMIITDRGKIIRQSTKDISMIGRNTQGVRLIRLGDKEKVVSIAKLAKEDT